MLLRQTNESQLHRSNWLHRNHRPIKKQSNLN